MSIISHLSNNSIQQLQFSQDKKPKERNVQNVIVLTSKDILLSIISYLSNNSIQQLQFSQDEKSKERNVQNVISKM